MTVSQLVSDEADLLRNENESMSSHRRSKSSSAAVSNGRLALRLTSISKPGQKPRRGTFWACRHSWFRCDGHAYQIVLHVDDQPVDTTYWRPAASCKPRETDRSVRRIKKRRSIRRSYSACWRGFCLCPRITETAETGSSAVGSIR